MKKLNIRKYLPRVYVCRDVILVMWRGWEWMIPRWFKDK